MKDNTEMTVEEMTALQSLLVNDFEDMEIFCYCTGTCVTLRCGVN